MRTIQDHPRNKAATAALVEAFHRRQGIIPFVGAGLSYDWKLPLWGQFLTQAAERCGAAADVAAALKANDYERGAEIVEEALGRRGLNRLIDNTFGVEIDPNLQDSAAVHVLPALAAGPVITTNFDHVVETVFRAAGRPFDLPPIWGARAQLAADGLLENYSILVKIHGDASHAGDRVLTLGEYTRHYGGISPDEIDTTKPLPLLLHRLFSSRSVLFLGCSLQADRTMSILRAAVRGSDSLPHFAIVEASDDATDFQHRTAFLEAHGITPIWYPPGQHQLIRPFLEHLKTRTTRRRVGYGGVPAALPPVPTPEMIERARNAREALEERQRRLREVVAEWDALSDLGERIAWFRRSRYILQYDAPDTYLRFASQLAEQARCEEPNAAAEFLIGSYIVGWVNGDRRAVEKLDAAAALLRPLEPGITHVDLLHTRALHAERIENFVEAERHSRAALRMARTTGLQAVYAWIAMWRMRAKILSALARPRAAKRYAARAIRAALRQDDRDELVDLWILASNLYFDADQPRKMLRAAQRALARVPPDELQQRATICDNLGVALFHLGDYRASIAAYREALWYEQQIVSDRSSQVITLMNLGWFEYNAYKGTEILGKDTPHAAREEALRRARDHYAQALVLAESGGESRLIAHVLRQQALVLAALGEIPRALKDLRRAARDARARNDDELATVLNNRGLVWERVPGGTPHALRAYDAALREARRTSDVVLPTVLYNYADALERLGRSDEALSLAEELASLDVRRHDASTPEHKRMVARLRAKTSGR